ncbi:MAG TPA: mannonate dehydratase, partial [Bryobacteraceae bacterium]|nr:mannonate dehydratase [Bryobacteraceae bacterium]
SPNIGVCLCVGCWLEGGELMGKDVVEAIKYFASQKKLFKVHLRNVSAPLPHSVETLLDDGYYDMYRVMKALVEVGFDGLVIPDHVPALGVLPGRREDTSGTGAYRPSELMAFNNAGLAYSIGYMNALLNAAKSETGRS